MNITEISKPDQIEKEIALRIREYRILSDMTQKDLADKAMVSIKTIARFEAGEDISFEKFIRILSALGISGRLEILLPDPADRPSYHLPERKNRKRVRHKNNNNEENSPWKWGDEA